MIVLLDETLVRRDLGMDAGESSLQPAAVLEAFVHHVEAGEIDSAVLLLSEHIQDAVGHEGLSGILSASANEILWSGGIEEMDIQTVAFSRDHVAMRLSIWYGDHRVETETVELVREGGRWRISLAEAVLMSGQSSQDAETQRAVLTHRPAQT
jgi:hypothetical protein